MNATGKQVGTVMHQQEAASALHDAAAAWYWLHPAGTKTARIH